MSVETQSNAQAQAETQAAQAIAQASARAHVPAEYVDMATERHITDQIWATLPESLQASMLADWAQIIADAALRAESLQEISLKLNKQGYVYVEMLPASNASGGVNLNAAQWETLKRNAAQISAYFVDTIDEAQIKARQYKALQTGKRFMNAYGPEALAAIQTLQGLT